MRRSEKTNNPTCPWRILWWYVFALGVESVRETLFCARHSLKVLHDDVQSGVFFFLGGRGGVVGSWWHVVNSESII